MEVTRAAAEFAAASHRGQRRKYSDEPYIRHPARVAARIADLGMDAEVVAAAWLHDVVEDCDVAVAHLAERFGERIARLVGHLSEPRKTPGGPRRAERKAAYRRRLLVLQGRDAIDVHTVKAADCLDNVPSVRDNDPGFWSVYGREIELLANVLTLADADLLAELRHALATRPVTTPRKCG
jgi:guanosine-3',5'-bis(diphosphate) 3'-pyrophosphohydrolase